MKYKNFLIRNTKGFLLARGTEVEGYSDLAIVRLSSEKDALVFDGVYVIVDIDSGLSVISAGTKKECLNKFNYRLIHNELENAIKNARHTLKYPVRVKELKREKEIWRESGYEIE